MIMSDILMSISWDVEIWALSKSEMLFLKISYIRSTFELFLTLMRR